MRNTLGLVIPNLDLVCIRCMFRGEDLEEAGIEDGVAEIEFALVK